MSFLCAPRNALAALTLCTGCAAQPAPAARPPVAAQTEVGANTGSGAHASCPRVERAPRMWTGFLVDVPSEVLVRALDVVTPIQLALGELFCAPERAECRPTELLAIELADARADLARVRLQLTANRATQELPLTLQMERGSWSAEAGSLAEYLARCHQLSTAGASYDQKR